VHQRRTRGEGWTIGCARAGSVGTWRPRSSRPKPRAAASGSGRVTGSPTGLPQTAPRVGPRAGSLPARGEPGLPVGTPVGDRAPAAGSGECDLAGRGGSIRSAMSGAGASRSIQAGGTRCWHQLPGRHLPRHRSGLRRTGHRLVGTGRAHRAGGDQRLPADQCGLSTEWTAYHLRCQGIQRVVLESTSDYWRPFYYLLEAAGLTVWLVNAAQAKNVPGRPKTDKIDAV
jgi:Transposase